MKRTCFTLTLALALTLAFAATSSAQNSWTNRYGPGGGSAIAVGGSGNVFVTGSSSGSSSGSDCATIKYSNNGMPLWTNRYNGPGNSIDASLAITADDNDNVFVTGYSYGSGGAADYVTIKYSDAGMPLWTNRYDGPGNSHDVARAIAVDGNGNVFVTGDWGNNPFAPGDCATIKYSNDGVPLWTNHYNGTGNLATGITVDGSGNVFVTGRGNLGYATIAYSNVGAPLWTNRYNSGAADAIAVDNTGNVFVTGGSVGDCVTIKYSNAGVPLWTNRYDGPGNSSDSATAIAVDSSGNVFVTGYSVGSGSGSDYATIKYSNNGVSLWTNRYNGLGNGDDYAYAIAVDGSSNVFVTGYSYGSDTHYDYATIKYSNDGVPLWTNRHNGSGNSDDYAYAIAVDGSDNVFVTGNSGDDWVTIKYEAAPSPQIAVLENPQVSAGNFSFDLTAEPGGQFAIQVSTNFVDWDAIREVAIPAGGNTNIVEAFTPAAVPKFYRAQRQ